MYPLTVSYCKTNKAKKTTKTRPSKPIKANKTDKANKAKKIRDIQDCPFINIDIRLLSTSALFITIIFSILSALFCPPPPKHTQTNLQQNFFECKYFTTKQYILYIINSDIASSFQQRLNLNNNNNTSTTESF